jgi:mannose-1-phosphate guanylyltransferase
MEKAGNVYVIAADMGWSDLGTWGSLFENSTKNKDKNVIIGPKLLAYDTTNTIIAMPDGKLAVVQGLDDYIIVEDNGILLICRRQDEQNIRKFVEDVKSQIDEKFV